MIEAYQGQPCVSKAERIDLPDGLAVRVTTPRGVDLVVLNPQGRTVKLDNAETDAELAIIRRKADGPPSGVMSAGTILSAGKRRASARSRTITAEILALDRQANRVTVQLPEGVDLAGRWVRIGNELRAGTYRILAQQRGDSGNAVLTLDVTSLLAEGLVEGTKDNLILNNVQIPLGGILNGRVVGRELSGAWITRGEARYRIDNVDFGNYYTKRTDWNVHPDPTHHGTVPAAALAKDFPTGAVFAIHAYAPGDTLTATTQAALE